MSRRLIAALVLLAVTATGCIGPPFYGESRSGWATETRESRGCLDDPAGSAQFQWYGHCRYHPYPAVDFPLPADGSTPIRAAESGFVFIASSTIDGADPAGFDCNSGQPTGLEPLHVDDGTDPQPWCRQPDTFVVLDHRAARPGYEPPEFTRYSHLRSIAVEEGRWVRRGDVIGYCCKPGMPSPHVHFDAFAGLRDSTPTGGMNTYAHQSDYGIMEWCEPGSGRWRIGGVDTFGQGTPAVSFGPC